MIKNAIGGFKQFILRGNVVDLAVGIMIGAAFNSVVSSLVKDILTPFIAAIIGKPQFANVSFTIHGAQFLYGDFLNNLISFLITAIAVYFFVVLPINKLNEKMAPKGPPAEATTKQCPECLSNIPIGATRCAYCTTVLQKTATTPQS
jgi:large conductance mechanosensitive channel